MTSSAPNRRFPPPWTAVRASPDCYQVRDATGVTLAWIFCRDDEAHYSFGASKLTSDEARRLARGIARLPEFMAQRRGFFERGGATRWNPKRPYHVALEDMYVREHWPAIDAICKLNSLPFNATGERIQQNGTWCVYEFAWQMDAILFWQRFQGRWLRGDEFHYPETPQDLPPLKELPRHPYESRRKPER
jgi:hypothetical protein